MALAYTTDSLSEHGNPLPQYDWNLKYRTAQSVGDKVWHKVCTFTLQDNPSLNPQRSKRAITRLYLGAYVYDSMSSNGAQPLGFLYFMAHAENQDSQNPLVGHELTLTPLSSTNIKDNVQFNVYLRKLVNPNCSEWQVELWASQRNNYANIMLQPVFFNCSGQAENGANVYHDLYNQHANAYERMNELFSGIADSSNALDDDELSAYISKQQLVKQNHGSDVAIQSDSSDSATIKLAHGRKIIYVAAKGATRTISTIQIDGFDQIGKRITLVCWNSVTLHNAGNLSTAGADTIICRGGVDYKMQQNEAVELLRLDGKWIQL